MESIKKIFFNCFSNEELENEINMCKNQKIVLVMKNLKMKLICVKIKKKIINFLLESLKMN